MPVLFFFLLQASSYLLCPVYSAISSAINDHISYSVARSCKIAIEVAWNVCCKVVHSTTLCDNVAVN